MYCKRHQRGIVAMCTECNSGVCDICADATSNLREECGTLCIPCYIKELNGSIEYYQQQRKSLLNNILISCILYAIGAFMAITGIIDGTYAMAILGLFFCGFYTAIAGWKKAEQAHNDYEYKHGASYTVTDSGVYHNDGFWGKLIVAIFATILGVIVTPFRAIVNAIKRKNFKNLIEELEEEISRVKAI